MILLASTDPKLLAIWRAAFGAGTGIDEVSTTAQLASMLVYLRPKIVVLDGSLLPAGQRPQAIRRLLAGSPASALLFVGAPCDEDEEIALHRSGVRGFAASEGPPALLRRLHDALCRGEFCIRRALLPRLLFAAHTSLTDAGAPVDRHERPAPLDAPTRMSGAAAAGDREPGAPLACLTSREREVAELVAHGEGNKRIAITLSITERTVKGHLSEVFRKLGVDSRLRLAMLVRGARVH